MCAVIHSWLYGDTWVIVATCFAGALALAALAHVLVSHSAAFAPLRTEPVVAPYFTAATSLFALFIAFNAAHAWSNHAAADHAAAAERAASARILHVATRFHAEPQKLLAPLGTYLEAAIGQEWRPTGNAQSAPAALASLRELEAAIWQARARQEMDASLADVLVRAVDELGAARATRIRLSGNVGDSARWLAMIALGFAAMLGIAMCHVDRPRTARLAIGIFALTVATAAAATAVYESPYTGAFAVGPEALARVLEELRAR